MIREITTAEEMDALPVGAVVLDVTGWAWQRETVTRWRGDRGSTAAPGVHLGPFTVLHVPGRADR